MEMDSFPLALTLMHVNLIMHLLFLSLDLVRNLFIYQPVDVTMNHT